MKKYLIHFIYMIVIAVFAVFSRMKSNDLAEQLQTAKIEAEKQLSIAEKNAEMASEQTILAAEQIRKTEEALKNCQNK